MVNRNRSLPPSGTDETDREGDPDDSAGPRATVESGLDGSIKVNHPLLEVSMIENGRGRGVNLMISLTESGIDAINMQQKVTLDDVERIVKGIFGPPRSRDSDRQSRTITPLEFDINFLALKERLFLQSLAGPVFAAASDLYDDGTARLMVALLSGDGTDFSSEEKAAEALKQLAIVLKRVFPGQNLLEAPEE